MMIFKKLIVRLRMWYADIEDIMVSDGTMKPGDWYMGQHKKRKKK